ncbi:DNA mismatch repair protein MLH3 isoform X5 [Momordica charantia]|uniref:DNA mismatch repair protein MLH3 isoform X5 n=1 Tax=Momordica charantia TaxID=3673 RepID=A0A6J1DVM2_MOMCH|nr:DNA mismatch repair protein MLH3 isoform X5 [Momordica charantia]
MGIIKPLPESVRSSVRTGIILLDVTRVVEELVYNSLDAGASKISISIGTGTSYVKVADDGSGITRDGLVLLGERYVTSKFHDLIDMDAKGRTFGFRGESLASISDVSLVEIITKTCGRANGYRKVMKGCKCLYLGVDDDMEDVGTTVIVRDLFYNQPVRRKQMQSSPKKVLQAVKKCVVRIALVHSKVSFKLVDCESESNVLCTYPSSSPLSLLRSGFGSEVSRSLHEVKIGDGDLKLSGYICSPFDSFTIKAVQYFYINRRFICKGQIHKLLNQLANRFIRLDPQTDHVFHSRKRSRPDANPAYILNLDCPGSFYDLIFESSKTFVQFKDWTPILTFIEEAIQRFWKDEYNCGKYLVHTSPIVREDRLWKDEDNMILKKSDSPEDVILFPPENVEPVKKSKMQRHQASVIDLFSPSAMFIKEDHLLSHRLHDKKARELNVDVQQTRMEFSYQADPFLKSWDIPLAKCTTAAVQKNDRNPWVPDSYCVSEVSLLDRRLTSPKIFDDNVEDNIFSPEWNGQSSKVHNTINGTDGSIPSSNFHEFRYDDNDFTDTKPFPRGCLSGSSFRLERTLIPGDKLNIHNNVVRRTQMQGIPDDEVDVLKLDSYIQGSDFCAGTSLQAELAEENIHASHFNKRVQKFFPIYQTRNSPNSHVTSSPILATEWDVDCFIVKDAVERSWRSRDRTPFRDLADGEERGWEFDDDIMLKGSNKKNDFSSCIDSTLTIDDVFDTGLGLSKFLEKPSYFKHSSPVSPDMHSCQKDVFNWRLFGKVCEKAYESPELEFGHQAFKQNYLSIERPKRCKSAPPFYKRKTSFYCLDQRKAEKLNATSLDCLNQRKTEKFNATNSYCMDQGKVEKLKASVFLDTPPHLELDEPRDSKRFFGTSNLIVKPCPVNDLLIGTRTDTKRIHDFKENNNENQGGEISKQSQSLDDKVTTSAIELCSKETQESSDLWIKWQHCCPVARNYESHASEDEISILDISSGFLSLASNSLVPNSIDKNFLEDAKVLLQLDNKFIPVVSGGTLAVIDQEMEAKWFL